MVELLKVGENGIIANLEESVESLPSFYKKKTAQGDFTLLTPIIVFKILEILSVTQAFQ